MGTWRAEGGGGSALAVFSSARPIIFGPVRRLQAHRPLRGAFGGHAVRRAGVTRFRPILLTSLTTFAGLTPLLLERSLQAQFLKPMAASLGFGVLFTTPIILLLVPVLYMILEDIKAVAGRLLGREPLGHSVPHGS